MPLPILGALGGLFGGGASGLIPSSQPAGPVTQTVTTGAIGLGDRYFGRGSVSATDTSASGGASVTAPASDYTGPALLVGAVLLVVGIVVATRGKG